MGAKTFIPDEKITACILTTTQTENTRLSIQLPVYEVGITSGKQSLSIFFNVEQFNIITNNIGHKIDASIASFMCVVICKLCDTS